MDECRWLQRMTCCSIHHLMGGQPAQFVINKRQQLVGGCEISLFDSIQNACEFTHSIVISWAGARRRAKKHVSLPFINYPCGNKHEGSIPFTRSTDNQ